LISNLKFKIKNCRFNGALLFIFILLLPTQLGKHFFLPFSYLSGVRSDYLAPTIYLTDIIVFLLLMVNLKTVFNFFKNPKILFLLFLLVLNAIFGILPVVSLFRIIKIIELLILFAVLRKWSRAHHARLAEALAKRARLDSTIESKRAAPLQIVTPLLVGGMFELTLSAWQLISRHSVQGIFYWFGERYLTPSMPDIAKASLGGVEFMRPYGTFSHPNSMAGFYLLVYFFILTNPLFNNRAGKTLPLQKYLFLFVTSLLIFLSFSKIAIISFLTLNVVFSLQGVALRIKNICRPCLVSRIIVIAVLSFIFLSAQGDALSLQKRLTLIGNSVRILADHPLTGTGIGAYLVAQNKIPINYGYYFQQPVHNIFLLFLTETGIIITGIITWLLVIWFRKRAKLISPLPLIFILLAIFITGLFDHYWLTLQQNLLLLPLVLAFI